MTAYYNEFEPYCAQWLRNLIAAGHLPAGDVDERDIHEVSADDLKGYDQCHFFAGIGGWPYALRLARWPDDRAVWTGSCPCQPLSSAGQRKGHADRRHIWPAFHALIAECRPATVFGEQVASRDGREWFAGVRADLEHVGYACGAADMPAAGVGAPHIRQRLWWLANAERSERGPLDRARRDEGSDGLPQGQEGSDWAGSGGEDGRLAHADGGNPSAEREQRGGQQRQQPQDGGAGGGLGDTASQGLQGERRFEGTRGEGHIGQPGPSSGNGFWNPAESIACGDGKARRIEPGIQPLAHGVRGRVGRLRAYGNAIVPQVAAEFIRASMMVEKQTLNSETDDGKT